MTDKLFAPKKKEKKKKKEGCDLCLLHEKCSSPKLSVYGKGRKKILILAANPTQREDQLGVPYQGDTGKVIRQALKPTGIDLKRDCWYINTVRCHTKKTTTKHINSCRTLLLQDIERLKPDKIIVLGEVALQSLLGARTSITGITKWTGQSIPDQELGCWIFPLQSPKYLIANEYNIIAKKFFEKEFAEAIKHNKEFPDNTVKKEQLNLITSSHGATVYLEGLLAFPPEKLAFDYETTGIKPYAEGHEIVCVSFCFGDVATCFPMFNDKPFRKALRRVLTHPKIKKSAANIQYEDNWTKEILGYNVVNWYWDTMLGTHSLDNRGGVSGLKFQTYVRFGELEYGKSVEKYIKSEDKSNNSFNKMKECPLVDLLTYCALDSFYEYKLGLIQEKELTEDTGKVGFDFFMEGALLFAEIHRNGMRVDVSYLKKQNKILLRKMKRLSDKIMNSEEVQKWNDDKKEFNFNSDAMLRTLLFDILKYTPSKKTKGGSPSVDAEALGKLKDDIPIVKLISKWKKLYKIQNTYLAGFIREETYGYIHPHFNLHTTKSNRSSSNGINFQNIPKRELLAYKTVRSGVIPRPGNQILEVDFSGMEVCISASYNKDPALIKYITDPITDMHRDTAVQLFMREKIPEGDERYLAKNSFVFPQFYGDYYKSCAESLWDRMSSSSKEHLESVGIKKYMQFENHVKAVEYDFWKKRFKVYDKWRSTKWNKYIRKLKLKSYTGFCYTGVMKKNEVINFEIQGSAFHVLLWCCIQLQKWLKDNNMKTKIIGQIHDSIILDVVPSELAELKPIIRQITCVDSREHFSWINVPLNIDADITEIDGNWAKLKKEEI